MLEAENAALVCTAQTRRDPLTGPLNHPHSMSVLIFDLKSLMFLSVNDTAVWQYGYSREEFLATTIKNILPRKKLDAFLRYTRSAPTVLMSTSIWEHHKRDGSPIAVEMLGYKFMFENKPAMLVLIKQISEFKQFKDIFAPELRKYRTAKLRSADIFSRVNHRMMLLELNRVIERLTGVTPNTVVAKATSAPGARLRGIIPAYAKYSQSDAIGQDAIDLPMCVWFPSWPKIIGLFCAQGVAKLALLPLRVRESFKIASHMERTQ